MKERERSKTGRERVIGCRAVGADLILLYQDPLLWQMFFYVQSGSFWEGGGGWGASEWGAEMERRREKQGSPQVGWGSCFTKGGLELTPCGAWTHKPWDHDLSQSQMLNPLSHPGAPSLAVLKSEYVDWTWRVESLLHDISKCSYFNDKLPYIDIHAWDNYLRVYPN